MHIIISFYDSQTHRHTDKETNKQTNIQTNKQTNKQIVTKKQSYLLIRRDSLLQEIFHI